MITKFNSFLNEANAVIDYSIMNWIEMFKIDVTKYDKQEEPLMNKFIGIVYGAKEREPDHFGDMLHMMAGEEDPNKKIDVLTPYKGLYRGYDPRSPNVEQPLKEDCRVKKDKNGNIIEIGGQVGEWKKVDIKKDIFVDLELYTTLLKQRIESNWCRFFPAWWSFGDEGPYPEDGLVLKIKEVRHISDAIVFIGEDGKEYYPEITESILRRRGPVVARVSDTDPYGEEDWEDENESYKN